MLDRETKERIADFFESAELVDFLQVNIEDVIEALEDQIEENLDEIEEFIGVRERMEKIDERD